MTNLLLELSRFIALTFVTGLWQGFALILVVALTLGFLPRLNAPVRFAIWAITFAAAALLPLLRIPAHPSSMSSVAAAPLRLGLGWAVIIASLRASAAVVKFVQLFHQAIRLRRICRNATPVTPSATVKGLLASASRHPRLCTSRDVDTPSIIGFVSPRLLIPDWLYPTLTEQELCQIVLHECEHLRRHDDWINLAQKLALALFPLNPALLFADRRLGLERELACDAGVIAATEAPLDYATCLTHLAERRIHRRSPLALALSAWNRQSELARRVHRLLQPIHAVSPAQRRFSLVLLSLSLTAAVITLSLTPNLISFADIRTSTLAAASEPSPTDDRVRSLPVVFREPVLTKTRSLALTTKPRIVRASTPARRQYSYSRNAAQADLSHTRVLLTISRTRSSAPRAVHAVLTEFSPTYAAVPFADGWLIIQL